MATVVREGEPQVFVLRFWPNAGPSGGWRAQAEHMPSGTHTPIWNMMELEAFVQEMLPSSVDWYRDRG